MLRNISLVVMCCLLAACSSTDRKLPVQSNSFFVRDVEQSKMKKMVYDTCQSLGWNVAFGEDNKVLANITRSDIDLYVSISCQDDGTCTINPVKISCAPSDEQRARRLFRRFIKNLKKYIIRNASAMSQKQSGGTKAITVIGGKKAITLSSQTITGKDTSGEKGKVFQLIVH